MWIVVRVASIAVLAAVALLLLGHGDGVIAGADRVLGLLDLGAGAGTGGAPSQGAVLVGALAGALAALVPPLERAVGQVVTLLHELGHTLVAAALGARPAGIVLRHDASGHATARWRGDRGPLRRVALATVAFVGLPAPAVAAAGGSELLVLAGPEPVLWSAALAGAVVALLARSPWSLLVAVALAGLALLALGEAARPWTGGAAVGLLVAVALGSALDALPRALGRIREGDDARVVAQLLLIPARLVRLLQVVIVLAASGWVLWQLLAPLWAAAAGVLASAVGA